MTMQYNLRKRNLAKSRKLVDVSNDCVHIHVAKKTSPVAKRVIKSKKKQLTTDKDKENVTILKKKKRVTFNETAECVFVESVAPPSIFELIDSITAQGFVFSPQNESLNTKEDLARIQDIKTSLKHSLDKFREEFDPFNLNELLVEFSNKYFKRKVAPAKQELVKSEPISAIKIEPRDDCGEPFPKKKISWEAFQKRKKSQYEAISQPVIEATTKTPVFVCSTPVNYVVPPPAQPLPQYYSYYQTYQTYQTYPNPYYYRHQATVNPSPSYQRAVYQYVYAKNNYQMPYYDVHRPEMVNKSNLIYIKSENSS